MTHFEIVTRAEIHRIVAPEVLRLLGPDRFETVDLLKWVRSIDTPIRQVFCFSQWKGGMVAPTWGLSLDFVPHVSGSTLKWHRTPKSALLDLVVDARDRVLDMPYHQGLSPIRERVATVVPSAVARASDFWNRFRAVSDLPAAFAWLQSYLSTGGLGFYNYVQHPIALAFVYARNSQPRQAQIELEKFLEGRSLSDKLAVRLRELLTLACTA